MVQFGNILSVAGATNTGEELSVVEFISFVDDAVMKANVRISQALSVGGATYLESTVTVHEASEFTRFLLVVSSMMRTP